MVKMKNHILPIWLLLIWTLWELMFQDTVVRASGSEEALNSKSIWKAKVSSGRLDRNCWAQPNPKITVPTGEHGGGNIVVWGCLAVSGAMATWRMEIMLTSKRITWRNLLLVILGQSWVFQQDNEASVRISPTVPPGHWRAWGGPRRAQVSRSYWQTVGGQMNISAWKPRNQDQMGQSAMYKTPSRDMYILFWRQLYCTE